MTLAEATAYLSTLEAAMLSGELSVRLADGRAITYQSLPDMERTAAGLRRDIARANGTPSTLTARWNPNATSGASY
jgi:hypothetical protein